MSPDSAPARNKLAGLLATAPGPYPEVDEALLHARRAVELAPWEQTSLNTLGVILYRTGRFAESIETLEGSLRAGNGRFAAFDLFFLAMAHHRLGEGAQARDGFDRAVRWLSEQSERLPHVM